MHSNFYDFVSLQCINSFQLIKTKFRVPATQLAWCLRVTELKTNYTPYSKMAKILEFFCFHANWPLWPRSRLNILFYYVEESVLLGSKPLVDSIRHYIRDPSGVFSVCHLCECRIVQ